MSQSKTNIAIFASGSGTNAQNIIEYFKEHSSIRVSYVICNKPDAYVLKRAKNLKVPNMLISKEQLYSDPAKLINVLKYFNINWIVLAGFNMLIPASLLELFPNRIINIHPALLPKYGGKGMYGMNVHRAVKAAGETETGITIHWVDEEYDSGDILFQAKCEVTPSDSPEAIAEKVHQLEYDHYPKVIENTINSNLRQ